MKEKILLINYYWPPCGGPAVQRWLDITRFLATLDIQTYVVTIDESVATYPFVDESLKTRIDASTKVFTTGTSELFSVYKRFLGKVPSTGLVDQPNPSFLQKIARFARGNFFLPDPRIGWNKHAYKQAAQLIREEGIQTIFTAGPPHSTHLVGLRLKKEFPYLRWVVDIHDYWTEISYLSLFYRTKIAAYFDRRIEARVLQAADAVMTHCQSSKRLLQDRISTNKDKVFVHTMGFNEELFSHAGPVAEQKEFVVSYVGMMAATYQPEIFLKAAKVAIVAFPEGNLKINIVGKYTDSIQDTINALGMKDHVMLTGYLPHTASIAQLYNSSALFMVNPKFDREEIHVPGKLYEYLAVFKPIINIGPKDGETAGLIDTFGAGQTFERTDEAGISQYLVSLMREWKHKGQLDLPYNEEIVRRFGRRNEVISLAKKIKTLPHG